MMKSIYFLLLLLLVNISCVFNQQKQKNTQILPSDEIFMEFNRRTFYMPILDATLNDSLPFKVFFDTGQPTNWAIASDSIKSELQGDSAWVQIGKSNLLMPIDYMESNRPSIFNRFGKKSIIIGWEYFKGKIIELSFDNQYIHVYEKLPDVTEYSKTKITVTPPPISYLSIPLKVVLQGKEMEDTVFIDTGNNGYASFDTKLAEKYDLKTEDALHGKALTNVGLFAGYSLSVDTIKIGDLYIANPNMRIGFRPSTQNRNSGNLLGVKTLQNFSVILDLINYDLYLKPLKQENLIE